MDIKVMEYAAEIARRQSFTKAAEHLHIAQPSLSQQIKKLEAELGAYPFSQIPWLCYTDTSRQAFH
ncbi:LysR family transcriptional regulator [Bacillus subtilis]|nr:LysR family transcriptional regulator [Bacillus subtilis]